MPSVLKHLVSCPHRALGGKARSKVERGLGQQASTCRSKITELCISSSEKLLDLHKGCNSRGAGLAQPAIVPECDQGGKEGRFLMRGEKKTFCLSRNIHHLCLENGSAVSKVFPPNNQSVLTMDALKMSFLGLGKCWTARD